MNNPEAIRYCNEVVRPMAERVRAIKADIDAATVTWFGTISSEVPNTSEAIEDGRESEGVSRLTGSDVVSLVSQLLAIQTLLNGTGVADVVSKPCVRPLISAS